MEARSWSVEKMGEKTVFLAEIELEDTAAAAAFAEAIAKDLVWHPNIDLDEFGNAVVEISLRFHEGPIEFARFGMVQALFTGSALIYIPHERSGLAQHPRVGEGPTVASMSEGLTK